MSTYQFIIKEGETYLVTGASGFLGQVLVERLIKAGAKVRCLARNEGNILKLNQEHPVEIYPGDVSDPVDVCQAMKGVRGVFHLAAFKHVGLAEKFARECVKSNTLGSLNILEATLHTPVDFVLGISTDKAARISGVYGASKFLMERLFAQFEQINPSVAYRIVRYGNVMYSTSQSCVNGRSLWRMASRASLQSQRPLVSTGRWTMRSS